MRSVPTLSQLAVAPLVLVFALDTHGQGEIHVFVGDADGDSLGHSVAAAGDVDADGSVDVIVGAWFDSTNGTNAGMARVYSGRDGSTLHTFYGVAGADLFGTSVDGAGDVDADGFADVIVGAPIGANNLGYARVFAGKDGQVIHDLLGDSAFDEFGWSVGGIGDANNDGFDDVVVGAPHDGNNGFESGMTRVFSGQDGTILFSQDGLAINYWFGWEVSGTGDVNNDGVVDVLSSAPTSKLNGDAAGAVRVMSGSSGATLHQKLGDHSGDLLGWSAHGAGDVNNDGFGDFVAGAPTHSGVGPESGLARVYSGSTGATLYTFEGQGSGSQLGNSVSDAGDLNADGFDDILVGAPHDADLVILTQGRAWVMSGLDGEPLGTFTSGSSSDIQFASAVSGAGDVDGDGLDDVLVGAPWADENGTDTGSAVLYSGSCLSVLDYGIGNPGSGGFTPAIAASGGLPALGNGSFRLQIDQGLGGSGAVLILGLAPTAISASWGTLLVDVQGPKAFLPLNLSGAFGQPGVGSATVFLPIPNNLVLEGLTVFNQVLVMDPGSSAGLSHSGGLQFTICDG